MKTIIRNIMFVIGRALAIGFFVFWSVLWVLSDLKTYPVYADDSNASHEVFSNAAILHTHGLWWNYTSGCEYLGVTPLPPKSLKFEDFTKVDRNFHLAYIIAGTEAVLDRGRDCTSSSAVGRFYVGLFSVAWIGFIYFLLAKRYGLGWAFSTPFVLLLLYNPWQLDGGNIINEQGYGVWMAFAFGLWMVSIVTSPQLMNEPFRIRKSTLLLVFLFSLAGVLTDYFFWTMLAVISFYLMVAVFFSYRGFLIILHPSQRSSLLKLWAVMVLGALAGMGVIAFAYSRAVGGNWFAYMIAEYRRHQVENGVSSIWQTVHEGWNSICYGFYKYFPAPQFYDSLVAALVFLTLYLVFKMSVKAKHLKGTLFRFVFEVTVKKRPFKTTAAGLWETHKTALFQLLVVSYLVYTTTFLFYICFHYILSTAANVKASLIFPIYLPFAFCAFVAFALKGWYGRIPRIIICVVLFLFFLRKVGVYTPHNDRDKFLFRSLPLITAIQPKQWDLYPSEVDLLESARLAWNMSYGHRDLAIRYPPSLKMIEMRNDVVQKMIPPEVGYNGSNRAIQYLSIHLFGIRAGITWDYFARKTKESPYDTVITDPEAKPLVYRFVLKFLDGSRQIYSILISNDGNTDRTYDVINVAEPERKATLWDRLLDGSRRHWFFYHISEPARV